METIITNIVVIGGFIFSALYQKKKIDSLQTALTTQNSVIEAMKSLIGIFDVARVKSYVQLSNEEMEKRTAKEITNIQVKYQTQIDELFQFKENTAKREEELIKFISAIIFEVKPQVSGRLLSLYISDNELKKFLNRVFNDAVKREQSREKLIEQIYEHTVEKGLSISHFFEQIGYAEIEGKLPLG